MPLIETPPESPRDSSPEASRVEEQPSRRVGGRYGDLDHSDLVHLLDEVDDERAGRGFAKRYTYR